MSLVHQGVLQKEPESIGDGLRRWVLRKREVQRDQVAAGSAREFPLHGRSNILGRPLRREREQNANDIGVLRSRAAQAAYRIV